MENVKKCADQMAGIVNETHISSAYVYICITFTEIFINAFLTIL